MAWRNIEIVGLTTGTLSDPSYFGTANTAGSWYQNLWNSPQPSVCNPNYAYGGLRNQWLFGDSQCGIYLISAGNGQAYLNGVAISSLSDSQLAFKLYNNYNPSYPDAKGSFFAGVDDDTQMGCLLCIWRNTNGTVSRTNSVCWDANEAANHNMYNLLTGNAVPPPYNWQSVPSISGKNGILSLAQIKEEYINDGESVSGASADHFTNLSTENRVDVLIDDALPAPEIGGTTVTVKYTIPSLSTGSYEYCKLVAKKNSMPEGPEDGDKIVDVDPSSSSIVIRGLDQLSRYYFVIFIEDEQGNTASSEPKSCETGRDEVIVAYDNGSADSRYIDIQNPVLTEEHTTPSSSDKLSYSVESTYIEVHTYHYNENGTSHLNVSIPLHNISEAYTKVKVDFYYEVYQGGFYTYTEVDISHNSGSLYGLAIKDFKNGIYTITRSNGYVIGDPDSSHSAINDNDEMSYTCELSSHEYLTLYVRSTNRRSGSKIRIRKIVFM